MGQASKVRSQGEDWGWLHEHRLNGTSAPQLAGRQSGKGLELPKRQESIVSGCTRRGDSFPICPQEAEHCLNELQRWAQAAAISWDHRDEYEMLMLLLQPPRTLCASTGHYPHTPRNQCSTPLPGSRDAGTSSPREHTVRLGCCKVMPASATTGSTCIADPLSPRPE